MGIEEQDIISKHRIKMRAKPPAFCYYKSTALGTSSTVTNTSGEAINSASSVTFSQSASAGGGVNIPLVAKGHVEVTAGVAEGISSGNTTTLSEALAKGTSEVKGIF